MKQKITLFIGILISIVCLYWVFKDVDFAVMFSAMRSINPLWLLLSLALFSWQMYLRAVRWGLLFRPEYQFSGRRMFRPLMICFALNGILPGRVGEFVRAFYVGKREKTGMSMALATVVSERIFDGVFLLLFLAVSLALLPDIDPELQVRFGGYTVEGSMLAPLMRKIVWGCVILVAGVIFLMLPGVERMLVAFIRGMPAFPEGFAARLVLMVQGVIRGFDSVRDWRNLLAIGAYSFAIWGLVAVSNLALAKGMTGVEEMNVLHASALMALTAVFILIPAAPGYWGLFEAGVLFSLKVLGLESDESRATAYALVLHLVQFLPIVIVGLYFAAVEHVSVKPAHAEAHPKERET